MRKRLVIPNPKSTDRPRTHCESDLNSHSPADTPASIEVQIGELVLDGFDPRDRYRIGDAIERELTRLLPADVWNPSLVESAQMDRLDAGTFQVKPSARGERIGVQVGQAIYNSLRNKS